MKSISLKNVRAFSCPEAVEIRPITVLVGENSTGKSTFLAGIRLCWDAATESKALDFNEEPFSLGSFDQIAHFRGGKAGRAKSFSLGYEADVRMSPSREQISFSGEFEFTKKGSHPFLSRQKLSCKHFSVEVQSDVDEKKISLAVSFGEKRSKVSLGRKSLPEFYFSGGPVDIRYLMLRSGVSPHARFRLGENSPVKIFSDGELDLLQRGIYRVQRSLGARPIAMAPIRSKPLRTYHPTSELHLSDGGHVPLLLAKAYFQDKDSWRRLKESLDEFGRQAGLFSSIDIRPLGRHDSDPFQLNVKIEGPSSNIVDVGYGVSQVLPLLVDPLLAERNSTFLLQQPEVHLHPRGQAQLANFLAHISKTRGVRFIVETHSDYFISRLQMAIKNGSISQEDVSIAYFARNGLEVAIHNLTLDEKGNYVETPPHYREFFLKEEIAYLQG